MPMPDKTVYLFDQTSAANAAISTGQLDLRDFDEVSFLVKAGGGTFSGTGASQLFMYDSGGSPVEQTSSNLTGAAATALGGWGKGIQGVSGGAYISGPVPAYGKIDVAAQGIGVTARLIVWGRRKFKGPAVVIAGD